MSGEKHGRRVHPKRGDRDVRADDATGPARWSPAEKAWAEAGFRAGFEAYARGEREAQAACDVWWEAATRD